MDERVINNIKSLGIDMISNARSGHPGIVLGAASIIFSDKEQGRRIGLLTGALASQMAEAKDYKEAVKQIVGEDKEREIEEEQTKRTAKQRDYYEVECIDTGTGTQKYKDYYSGVMIKAGPTYIDACLNELNQYIHFLHLHLINLILILFLI